MRKAEIYVNGDLYDIVYFTNGTEEAEFLTVWNAAKLKNSLVTCSKVYNQLSPAELASCYIESVRMFE